MSAYLSERRRLQSGEEAQDSALARGRAAEARHQAAEADAWSRRRKGRTAGG